MGRGRGGGRLPRLLVIRLAWMRVGTRIGRGGRLGPCTHQRLRHTPASLATGGPRCRIQVHRHATRCCGDACGLHLRNLSQCTCCGAQATFGTFAGQCVRGGRIARRGGCGCGQPPPERLKPPQRLRKASQTARGFTRGNRAGGVALALNGPVRAGGLRDFPAANSFAPDGRGFTCGTARVAWHSPVPDQSAQADFAIFQRRIHSLRTGLGPGAKTRVRSCRRPVPGE
jgi:hypothetical protein